jgi:hypothetical protein
VSFANTYTLSKVVFSGYTSDGFQDQTIDFGMANHFITAIDGFLTQQITNEGIVCEENAIVLE